MKKVILVNTTTRTTLVKPTGFNIWAVLIGVFAPFFRRDWIVGLIALTTAIVLEYISGQSWIVPALLAAVYNRIYIAMKLANDFHISNMSEAEIAELGLTDMSIAKFYGNELRNFIFTAIVLAIFVNALPVILAS